MYFIFFQYCDDAKYFSGTLDEIEQYMLKECIRKEEVILVKGEMISGWENKHWPRLFKNG
jgi:hypothetical protein